MLLLHTLLFGLNVVLVYPGFIVCYYMPYKQIPVQLHEFQIFIFMFCIDNPSFFGPAFWIHRAQTLSSTSVCARLS